MSKEKVDHGPRIGADPELFVATVPKEGGTKEVDMNSDEKFIAERKWLKACVVANKTGKPQPAIPTFKKKVAAGRDAERIVPVCGRIGGTKDAPIVIQNSTLAAHPSGTRVVTSSDMVGQFAIQEDNVMFEFNVPATRRSDYFSNNIGWFLSFVEAAYLKPQGLMFVYANRHKFAEADLEHPQAKTIGCSPDFCAYNPRDDQSRQPFGINQLGTQRFCGGHLHVQYNTDNVPREIFVKFMDLAVGLPFLDMDRQGDRRKFYGCAGVYRPKSYGIEYRTPSNFWLAPMARSAGVPRTIIDNIMNVANVANTDPESLAAFFHKMPWDDTQACINSEDLKTRKELLGYARAHAPFTIQTADGE